MSKAPPKRPDFIWSWRDILSPKPVLHPFTKEKMGRMAPFSAVCELMRLGIHVDELAPGWRSSNPHAERDEEEFVFVLEGTPDLWSDGHLYRMSPGEAAGWPGRNGQGHCLINNTDEKVVLVTIGEASRYNSKIHFPVNPEMEPWLKRAGKMWLDAPRRKLGPHDGLSDAMRKKPSPKGSLKKAQPSCVVRWQDHEQKDDAHYPNDDELLSIGAPLARILGLTRLGIWHERLPPGRRTSWPHAEYDEEEFVFVVAGKPDVWLDGVLHPLQAGDGVGFPDRTGIAHTFLNNSDEDVRLLVVGEASRQRSNCHYPLHPKRNEEIGERHWKDVPGRRLGPHDGKARAGTRIS